MAVVINKNSLLSNRYLITKLELKTSDGDRIYQAIDQVLGRHVNIFIPSPATQDQVIDKAKDYARDQVGNYINILDISALNASQLFIVTTTASPQKILSVFKPAIDDPPEAETTDVDAPETCEAVGKLPYVKSAPHEDGGRLPGTGQEQVAEAPDCPDDKEAEDTDSFDLIKKYLADDDEQASDDDDDEEQVAEASMPMATATHDFIIPFPTESQSIIRLKDEIQKDLEYNEENLYSEEKRKSISTSWILGTALIVLTLALAYAGIFFLAQALQTTPTALPNNAAQATAANANGQNGEANNSPDDAGPTIEITGITRSIDGSQDTEARNTSQITNIITPNAGVWSTLQYSDDAFGGFFKSLTLNLELKERSTIHEISIDQQETTGGMFTVYASDDPTPEPGAQEIAQGSFTGPNIKLPLSKEVEATYIHITFTQLPKLQNPNGSYPYGIRLSQISVS